MLALVSDAYGAGGGIAQYNRDFLSAVACIGGWRIEVLPRLVQRLDFPPPPEAVVQHPPRFHQLQYSLAALWLALRTRPQVIFCGHLFMLPLAVLVGKLVRCSVLLQLHGREAWERPSWLIRQAMLATTHVACVSADTRARLLTWAPYAEHRTTVLPNTVGDQFTPGDKQAARHFFDLADSDGPVLLSVGRLVSTERYKGQDRVIAALPVLIKQHPRLVYLVAGQGDDRHRLQGLAQALGVEQYVRFLGAVPSETLPDLYRAAELFVLPSTGEGFGIVYLEAMACGTPALGLRCGGAPDALRDGELGVCVQEADFQAALLHSLKYPQREGSDLSEAVRQCFGKGPFRQRVAALMCIDYLSPSETTRADRSVG